MFIFEGNRYLIGNIVTCKITQVKAGYHQNMNWEELIHSLCEKRKLSLRQLAQLVDINHVFISEVARGTRPASPKMKLRLLKLAGVRIDRDALLALLPDELAAEIRQDDRK